MKTWKKKHTLWKNLKQLCNDEKDLIQNVFKIYFTGVFLIKTAFKIKEKKVLYSVTEG